MSTKLFNGSDWALRYLKRNGRSEKTAKRSEDVLGCLRRTLGESKEILWNLKDPWAEGSLEVRCWKGFRVRKDLGEV